MRGEGGVREREEPRRGGGQRESKSEGGEFGRGQLEGEGDHRKSRVRGTGSKSWGVRGKGRGV